MSQGMEKTPRLTTVYTEWKLLRLKRHINFFILVCLGVCPSQEITLTDTSKDVQGYIDSTPPRDSKKALRSPYHTTL